jgi:hypothetical protein
MAKIFFISAKALGQFTTFNSTISVTVNGAAYTPSLNGLASATIVLDTIAPGSEIGISVTPDANLFWPAQGTYLYDSESRILPKTTPPEFGPLSNVEFFGSTVISLMVHLTRLKDVTQKVFNITSNPPPFRKEHDIKGWGFDSWNPVPRENHHFTAPEPVTANGLAFVKEPLVAPDVETLVFEITGVSAPKLISVSWPKSLNRLPAADPTQFLVYFHPNIQQNLKRYYETPEQKDANGTVMKYPYKFDYCWFIEWANMFYKSDDILTRDMGRTKGLCYQIEVSKKKVACVVPCSAPGGKEVGTFKSAASASVILKEIQGYMYRRIGVYEPPDLGRCAIAAYSAANTLVRSFLNSAENKEHPFYLENLQELYLLDPPVGKNPSAPVALAKAALEWQAAGNAANKMIRLYTQWTSNAFPLLINQGATKAPLFVATPDNRRSILWATIKNWTDAVIAHGGTKKFADTWDWAPVHAHFAGMMITDALRRSGFKE